MKWNTEDCYGNPVTYYKSELVEEIKKSALTVLNAGHCNNCDGCGLDEGCAAIDCGTYQANKIVQLIERADNVKKRNNNH